MLKIFQTGDNHIGLKYASHEQAEALISARINAFENMVAIANKENCALFVITGDLFENTYSISKRDVKTLLDMLSCFNGTVVVLPGNHDYYDKDVKVWQYFKDVASGKDNIMLLTEYRPYSITADGEDVVLYPAHCTSLHSEPGRNNLDWIKAEEIASDDTYRIGIAHGAVQGETMGQSICVVPVCRNDSKQTADGGDRLKQISEFVKNTLDNFTLPVRGDMSCNSLNENLKLSDELTATIIMFK